MAAKGRPKTALVAIGAVAALVAIAVVAALFAMAIWLTGDDERSGAQARLDSELAAKAAAGDTAAVRASIEKGADPHAQALFNAIRSGSEEAVAALLDAGADPRAPEMWLEARYRGALGLAKARGLDEVVRIIEDYERSKRTS